MPEAGGRIRGGLALVAGRYELIRDIGDRGEFQEWEGFDSSLERVVLVRLAPHDALPDTAAVRRFWHAARTSARLHTATGERVLDAGTDSTTGRAFLICEWPDKAAHGRTSRGHAEDVQPVPLAAPGLRRQLPAGRLVLSMLALAVLLGIAVIGPGVAGWVAWVNAPLGAAQNSFVLPQAAVATPVETPAPTIVAAALPTTPASKPNSASIATATVSSAGAKRRIVNTDGRGVALRDGPAGNRLPGKGYDEGVTVTAFESSSGWTRIRGSDGREGWVLSVTLAP